MQPSISEAPDREPRFFCADGNVYGADCCFVGFEAATWTRRAAVDKVVKKT